MAPVQVNLNVRSDKTDQRLDEIDSRLTRIEGGLTLVFNNQKEILTSMGQLQDKMDETQKDVKRLADAWKNVKPTIDDLKDQLAKALALAGENEALKAEIAAAMTSADAIDAVAEEAVPEVPTT